MARVYASSTTACLAVMTEGADPLYFGTNDTLALTISGSTQYVKAEERIGIGIDPTEELDISATNPTIRCVSTSATGVSRLAMRNSGGGYLLIDQYGTSATGTHCGIAKANLQVFAGYYGDGFLFKTHQPDPIYFGTDDTLALTIDGPTQEGTWTEPLHFRDPATAKTADYTATDSDCVIDVDATSGDVTITLQAVTAGRSMHIRRTDNSSNTVTVDGDGAETINGNTAISLASQYDAVHLIGNSAETSWGIY